MFTYRELKRRPAALRSLTGLTVAEFDQIVAEAAVHYEAAEDQRLARPNRQRRRGAGGQYRCPLADRLLLTLVWLRVYPTEEVLGYLFGVHKSTVCRRLEASLPLLRQVTRRDLSERASEQRRLSWKELLTEFPEV